MSWKLSQSFHLLKKTVKIEVLTGSLDLGVNVSSLSISSHGGCLSTTVCFNSGDTCSSMGSSVEEDIFRSYVKSKEGRAVVVIASILFDTFAGIG